MEVNIYGEANNSYDEIISTSLVLAHGLNRRRVTGSSECDNNKTRKEYVEYKHMSTITRALTDVR